MKICHKIVTVNYTQPTTTTTKTADNDSQLSKKWEVGDKVYQSKSSNVKKQLVPNCKEKILGFHVMSDEAYKTCLTISSHR